ncbi:hypothetical protein [Agromyces arachidis]|uniref:hypothetical protein n=1 Tax=Agromyces arachidis TaxID=766966 RepID=UPI0040561AA8
MTTRKPPTIVPRKTLLPAFRRSTFRAPDPEAAARFDPALPGATADDERQPSDERDAMADLRTESIETALAEQQRLVAERLLAEAAADREAAAARIAHDAPTGPAVARSSFLTRPVDDDAHRPRHPRHRADRIGNRRPTSGSRRPLLVG